MQVIQKHRDAVFTRLGICMISALFLSTSPMRAAEVYVNQSASAPTGRDGKSWATGFASIQEGVDLAAVGNDEVWVAQGVYPAFALKSGVAVYGGFSGNERDRDERDWKKYATIVDGQRQSTAVTIVPEASVLTVLDGFTLRNGSSRQGGGILCGNYAQPLIAHNIITNNSSIQGGGILCLAGASPAIVNNVISNNTGTVGGGTVLWPREDSRVPSISGPLLKNNLIVGNRAMFGGSALLFNGPITATVANNTFAENVDTPRPGIEPAASIVLSDNSSITFANNIVAFNMSGIYIGVGPNQRNYLRDNCIYGNMPNDYEGLPYRPLNLTGVNGNISADPRFADRAKGDYRLQAGSPCIDAGDDIMAVLPATDLAGGPRVQGAHVDIGVYEWAPAPTLADAARALRVAGGLSAFAPDDTYIAGPYGIVDIVAAVVRARQADALDAPQHSSK